MFSEIWLSWVVWCGWDREEETKEIEREYVSRGHLEARNVHRLNWEKW